MALGIISTSASKLNLSRRQTALFQKIILTGSSMAELIGEIDEHYWFTEDDLILKYSWKLLMLELKDTLTCRLEDHLPSLRQIL